MVEDMHYSARLDEGWNLEIVREAAYASLAAAGREKMHFRPPEEQNAHKVGITYINQRKCNYV